MHEIFSRQLNAIRKDFQRFNSISNMSLLAMAISLDFVATSHTMHHVNYMHIRSTAHQDCRRNKIAMFIIRLTPTFAASLGNIPHTFVALHGTKHTCTRYIKENFRFQIQVVANQTSGNELRGNNQYIYISFP